ncbi:hypothetical protein Tco_0587924 [Tanacetum coccineum]
MVEFNYAFPKVEGRSNVASLFPKGDEREWRVILWSDSYSETIVTMQDCVVSKEAVLTEKIPPAHGYDRITSRNKIDALSHVFNPHHLSSKIYERVKLLMAKYIITTARKGCKLPIPSLKHCLPPEDRVVTDVKLVRDLHTTNFDQLNAYLEQHELHANEVCIMRERNQDPVALAANHQMTPSHFNTY